MTVHRRIIVSPHPMDLVRIIRLSIQCYTLGLKSFIPIIGLFMGQEAIRSARQLAAETAEKTSLPELMVSWMLLIVVTLVGWFTTPPITPAVVSAAFCATVWYQVWTVRKHLATRHWNPARRQFHFGYALGVAGCLFPVFVAAWVGVFLRSTGVGR